MKRVTNWFSKKKKHVISNGIDADAVPEQPRDIPQYFPKESNLHYNFQRDDCCSSNHGTCRNISSGNGGEIRDTQLIGNGLTANPPYLNLPVPEQEDVEVASQQLASNLLETIERLPVQNTATDESGTVSLPDNLSVNSSDNLSRVSSTNSMAVQEADSPQDLPMDCVSKKGLSNKKNGGNTYVITITNSAHFHIGTKKTINYPGSEDCSAQKREIQFSSVNDGKLVELNGNEMLDIKDRLSEDDLLQISLSISDKWVELAKNLGLKESTIQELEEMNGSDYNLIVYDVLHEYLNRYPNTTVGFMVNVLKKSNEIEAIRKLTEKR